MTWGGGNKQAKLVVEKQRANELIPGTVEYQNLEAINEGIQAHNDALKASGSKGMKGRKRLRTVENVYKHVDLTRAGKKGGIDWFLYRKFILLPHLYKFYEEVRVTNAEATVWLIEDNVPSHSKAVEVCRKDKEERGIKEVDWPANSPDLHPIEEVWFYTDEMLESQWRDIKGAGNEAQLRARKAIIDVWESEKVEQDAQTICNH